MTVQPSKEMYRAINALQCELVGVFKTTEVAHVNSKRGSYTYQYVALDSLLQILTEPMAKHGLMQMACTEIQEGVGNVVCVRVIHVETGQCVESRYILGGTPDDFRVVGGWLTYMHGRMLLKLLGLAPDKDDTETSDAYTQPPSFLNQHTAPVQHAQPVPQEYHPQPPNAQWQQTPQQQQQYRQQAPQQQYAPHPQPGMPLQFSPPTHPMLNR